MSDLSDPFREARQRDGVLKCPFHGEDIVMILRHEDVRQAAKDNHLPRSATTER